MPHRSLRLLAAATALLAVSAAPAPVRTDPPQSIRGAVYIPFDAYNAPQMWRDFDARVADRDLGYAQKIHVNAIRVWASYEYWRMEPVKFQARFDQLLQVARAHGIRVLVSLFENDGVEPTTQHMWDTNPATALDVRSPGTAIAAGDPSGWAQPQRFLTWFMQRYGDDGRLLAIEVMNEPREAPTDDPATFPFAMAMLKVARAAQRSVPLTMGTDRVEEAAAFAPLGIDVLQFHVNFPASAQQMEATIRKAIALGGQTGKPAWLTEWQRTRPKGSGWGNQPVAADERGPDYSSLAPTIQRYPVGNFFWSLMMKRAYLGGQRKKGTVNGLFWPDGSVVSLADARAIARDPKLDLVQTPLPADWGLEAASASARSGG